MMDIFLLFIVLINLVILWGLKRKFEVFVSLLPTILDHRPKTLVIDGKGKDGFYVGSIRNGSDEVLQILTGLSWESGKSVSEALGIPFLYTEVAYNAWSAERARLIFHFTGFEVQWNENVR